MDLSKYVYHSVNDLNDGCCVLVGNLIITAGHVLSNNVLTIIIEGTTYNLSKENALIYKWDGDNMNATASDIAIFNISSLSSPLELDATKPCADMTLKSISYEHGTEQTDEVDFLFGGKISNEYIRLHECDAIITEVDGNFFQCKTSIVLKPGSSGSPVFRNGKVFGILHGGLQGKPYCVFQSSASIIELLKGVK